MTLKNAALPQDFPLRSNLMLFPYINRIDCVSRPRNAQPKSSPPNPIAADGNQNGLGHRLGGDEIYFSRGMTQNGACEQRAMATLPERPRRDSCVRQRLRRGDGAVGC